MACAALVTSMAAHKNVAASILVNRFIKPPASCENPSESVFLFFWRMLGLETAGDGEETLRQNDTVLFQGYSHRILDFDPPRIGIFYNVPRIRNARTV